MFEYGGSFPYGKEQIAAYLKQFLEDGDSILDVGAGGGTYYHYLGPNYKWSAVEIWHNSALYLQNFYETVYEIDIKDFDYPEDYDLIIFGDVLEHLSVEDAQRVLKKAKQHTKAILIAVPYNYEQDEMYGNKAEIHLQPDLTPTNFEERYPGYQKIMTVNYNEPIYGYYFWIK